MHTERGRQVRASSQFSDVRSQGWESLGLVVACGHLGCGSEPCREQELEQEL
jgi:hypothetical protein